MEKKKLYKTEGPYKMVLPRFLEQEQKQGQHQQAAGLKGAYHMQIRDLR